MASQVRAAQFVLVSISEDQCSNNWGTLIRANRTLIIAGKSNDREPKIPEAAADAIHVLTIRDEATDPRLAK